MLSTDQSFFNLLLISSLFKNQSQDSSIVKIAELYSDWLKDEKNVIELLINGRHLLALLGYIYYSSIMC